jgi:hypothetical protein
VLIARKIRQPWRSDGAEASRGGKRVLRRLAQKSERQLHDARLCRGGKVTAEIAIINRQAIALAADSAVTVGQEKVWKTANKLFSLGPQHDIAIMVYGSGDFLSLPWEVVVKTFRRRVTLSAFTHVRDCANEFRAFLESRLFEPPSEQQWSVLFPLIDIMDSIASELGERRKEIEAVRGRIAAYRDGAKRFEVLFPDMKSETFCAGMKEEIEAFACSRFGEVAAQALIEDLCMLSFDLFRAKVKSPYSSGLVVAGFGADEYFPCLMHYTVDGRFGDYVRWWEDSDCADLNDPQQHNVFPIVPFAQQDQAFQFLTGVSSNYLNFLDEGLAGLMHGAFDDLIGEFVPDDRRDAARAAADDIARQAAGRFMEKFRSKVTDEQFRPIGLAVSALPKEEMAAMAEALVDITSLKRKVDSKLESVGGPVDVAVISKGDGFVWIKRKYYFNLELNPDFMRRRVGS